jgi:hypothetical protein
LPGRGESYKTYRDAVKGKISLLKLRRADRVCVPPAAAGKSFFISIFCMFSESDDVFLIVRDNRQGHLIFSVDVRECSEP